MKLTILLPTHVFATLEDVECISVDTIGGSMGVLPHRRDCIAALAPGILSYVNHATPVYLGIDSGVLVKTGANVAISVRNAIAGASLGELHAAIQREFLTLDERERQVRTAIVKLEAGFVGRFAEFHRAQ